MFWECVWYDWVSIWVDLEAIKSEKLLFRNSGKSWHLVKSYLRLSEMTCKEKWDVGFQA